MSEALADWLGEMPEARNAFDHTDEATTVITIDVEVLARRLAVEIHNTVAARVAAAEALADEWQATYDRWSNFSDVPRVAIFRAHATRLRKALRGES